METGPHQDYVLEVVVWNVWGLVMGDGTLENLRSTRPLLQRDSLQANMLRVMQSSVVPPEMRF